MQTAIETAYQTASKLFSDCFHSGMTQPKAAKQAVDHVFRTFPAVYDHVCDIVESFTYDRRRYPGCSYVWPIAPADLGIGCMDPWTGTRYPKAVLFMDVLTHLATRTEPVQA